jgi:hypothetical protein
LDNIIIWLYLDILFEWSLSGIFLCKCASCLHLCDSNHSLLSNNEDVKNLLKYIVIVAMVIVSCLELAPPPFREHAGFLEAEKLFLLLLW